MSEGLKTARVRVGVIGLGRIARAAHLPALYDSKRAEIVGLMDALPTQLENFPGVPTCVTVEELLELRPDAVYVLTPKRTHATLARQLLAAGVHVFCEKPIATTLEESEELVIQAEEAGLTFMVGFNRRFAPVYRAAKALSETGLPTLGIFQKNRTGTEYRATLENTIHMVDLARFIFGDEVTKISAAAKFGDPFNEDSCTAMLEFASGSVAVIVGNRGAGQWVERVELYGPVDRTVVVNAPNELSVIRGGVETRTTTTADNAGLDRPIDKFGFKNQVEHFFDCVQGGVAPVTSGRSALRTQELAEQVLAAAGLPIADQT